MVSASLRAYQGLKKKAKARCEGKATAAEVTAAKKKYLDAVTKTAEKNAAKAVAVCSVSGAKKRKPAKAKAATKTKRKTTKRATGRKK